MRTDRLSFGKGAANAKLAKLEKRIGKRILTFSLPAGKSCPWARECRAQVLETEGGLCVKDGPHQKYRCYAASMEARYSVIYESRKHNLELCKAAARKSKYEVQRLLYDSAPSAATKLGGLDYVFRQHVAGDYFNLTYMRGWCLFANSLPNAIFYGHTKSLPLLFQCLEEGTVPLNMRWTISHQTPRDELEAMDVQRLFHLAGSKGVRLVETFVVNSEQAAARLGLENDKDDFLAYEALKPYAIIIHGTQPKKVT